MTNYQKMFADQDNKLCLIEGRKCRIKVNFFNAVYPYRHVAMQAYAMPINKQDPIYDLESEMYSMFERVKRLNGKPFYFKLKGSN